MADYKVTIEEDKPGCAGPVIGAILIIIALVLAFGNSGSKNHSSKPNNSQSNNSGYSDVQNNTTPIATTMPDKINLADLHVIDQDTDVLNRIETDTTEDFYGKKYNGPYFQLVSNCGYSGWTESYVEVATNGEYNTLTGTFFADANYEDYKAVFRIYADGQLIYESAPLNRRTDPIDFSVPINGAKTIKVASLTTECDSPTQATYVYLVNAVVHK